MKKNEYGFFCETARLTSTKNIMVCVSVNGVTWKYFSKNTYGTLLKATQAADEFMKKLHLT